MHIQLRVVRGKPRGSALRFGEGEFVFGRGPECHVRPNSEMVSRQHCLLRVTTSGAHIRDLGSSNGTLVNGTRVVEELSLQNGDLVQLGPLLLQVEVNAPPGPLTQTLLDAPVLGVTETLLDAPTYVAPKKS